MDNFGIYKLISSLKNGEEDKNFNRNENNSNNLGDSFNGGKNSFAPFLSLIPTLFNGENNNLLSALSSLFNGIFKQKQEDKLENNIGKNDGETSRIPPTKTAGENHLNLQNNNPLIKTFLSHDEFVKKVKEKSGK